MFERYPIHELIESRRKSLGIGRGELATRCGFKNVFKGMRRIDSVCNGDLDSAGAKMVLANLPAALEVDKDTVETAIRATAEMVLEAQRRAEAEREAA